MDSTTYPRPPKRPELEFKPGDRVWVDATLDRYSFDLPADCPHVSYDKSHTLEAVSDDLAVVSGGRLGDTWIVSRRALCKTCPNPPAESALLKLKSLECKLNELGALAEQVQTLLDKEYPTKHTTVKVEIIFG